MSQFPHLGLPDRIKGSLRPPKPYPRDGADAITLGHLKNRNAHGKALKSRIDELSQAWKLNVAARREAGLPELPDKDILPVLLKVDTNVFDIESLRGFGIEIIGEFEDGYVIGASASDFSRFKKKIEAFIAEKNKDKKQNTAQVWDMSGEGRIERILSDDLLAKWGSISDDKDIIVELGVACYVKVSGDEPVQKKATEKRNAETRGEYEARLEKWRQKKEQKEIERDDLAREMEDKLQAFVAAYDGEFLSGFVDHGDGFSCRVRICGQGLKDIVQNYSYLLDASEPDVIEMQEGATLEIDAVNPELIPPPAGYPKVCIIDSGVQEQHKLLAPAVDTATSRSFINGIVSTVDEVSGGGHGTKVAGAVLYPRAIPREGSYQLPCFIQNARVLNCWNSGALTRYQPELMEEVVDHFDATKVFNMSITTCAPCRLVHMSPWAETIDRLMYAKDKLFIISAGNVQNSKEEPKEVVKKHLGAGRPYPDFLREASNRIANPAQSSFALTVGSVCLDKFDSTDRESFGGKDYPSSFSRTGLGLWGMVKPDVVEYAGDFVRENKVVPFV